MIVTGLDTYLPRCLAIQSNSCNDRHTAHRQAACMACTLGNSSQPRADALTHDKTMRGIRGIIKPETTH